MGTIATLEKSTLQVDPGGEVATTLKVRNTGSVVDEFTFDVLGPLAPWGVVEPAVVRLLPGMEEQVQVHLRPPRSPDVPTGPVPFAVRVNSKEDPQGSAVEEWIVSVEPFGELTAELLPRTSRGRRKATHELALDNRGNERVSAELTAYDDTELLDFEFSEPGVVLEPNTAVFTRLTVRPRKRLWRGADKTWPFKVEVTSPEGTPVVLDGTMMQQAVLPKWLGRALLALLALLLLLVLLWYTLLKPTIESAAREGVEEELAAQAAQLAAAEQQLAEQADETAVQGAAVEALVDNVNEINDVLERDPVEVPTAVLVESPRDVRLAAAVGPGGTASDQLVFGQGETFRLTDLVLQNPAGNVGELRVLRGSQTLLVVALENFRDLDYHFVGPIIFSEGDSLVLQVLCRELTAPGATQCSVGGYFSGTVQTLEPVTSSGA
jgi:hypothetical protein